MKRFLGGVALLLAAFAAFAYLNNSALLATPGAAKLTVLAHRGMAQTFGPEGLTAETCTAARIHTPVHPHLENTLDSMRAAFAAGADIVEFDIHPTTDGQFAVFHDWTFDCRTEGRGVTREQSLATLKALDIGYGYTADGGKTFPFRGKGVGLMPSLDEVLAAFPDKRFLIHVKGNTTQEGEHLVARLAQLPLAQRRRLMVYGGDRPVAAVRRHFPDMPVMSKGTLKQCLLAYLAIDWSGVVPEACENSITLVPVNYAGWLWGWPHRFLSRMEAAGTPVFVVGPWDGGEFSTGIDSVAEFERLGAGFTGGVWTNRIDVIGPLARKSGT